MLWTQYLPGRMLRIIVLYTPYNVVPAALNQTWTLSCFFWQWSVFKDFEGRCKKPSPKQNNKKNFWRTTLRRVFLSVVSWRLTHALLQKSLFSFSIFIHCNGTWITAIVLLRVSGVFSEALFSSLPPISCGSVCRRLTYILYKFSVTSFKYFSFI